VALWPRGRAPDLGIRPSRYAEATVTSVHHQRCDSVEVPGALSGCRKVGIHLTSGAAAGTTSTFTVLDTELEVPALHAGDHIVLLDAPSSPAQYRYSFVDFQRGFPLVALTILFGFVVIAFGRKQGVRALVGLAASAAVLVLFIVPALLRGSPALLVALVGTVAVAYLALYLAHGFNPATTVALAGTLVSLGVIAVLSLAIAAQAHLTGLGDEAAQTLRITAGTLDLRGLLVAGVIVGALGVLDDVTVTQVSTVQALLRADPTIGRRELYREATHVGRDHIASTVNTLVLAYAGASLPLLLFFAEGTAPTGRILTGELVAVEIVRMLVGSIGLVLSVPVTTALAAAFLTPAHARIGHDHGPDRHAEVVAPGPDADADDPDDVRPVRRRRGRRGAADPAPRPARWEDFAPRE
jgi:uncharacterized membrane protein